MSSIKYYVYMCFLNKCCAISALIEFWFDSPFRRNCIYYLLWPKSQTREGSIKDPRYVILSHLNKFVCLARSYNGCWNDYSIKNIFLWYSVVCVILFLYIHHTYRHIYFHKFIDLYIFSYIYCCQFYHSDLRYLR